MALLDQAIVVARVLQIALALIAFFIAIATHMEGPRHNHNELARGTFMMAAIMTLFDTAALGCVGLFAVLRPQDLAWYLLLVFDIGALAASTAAGKCISGNAIIHEWDIASRIVVIFAYLCTIPIALSIMRTVYLQSDAVEESGGIQLPKEHADAWTPAEIRKLERRVEQLEAEARMRPFTPSETIARWTAVSGNATLSPYQSEKDL